MLLDLHMPDERDYVPESVKLQVLQNAGCIIAISVWNDYEAKALAEQFGAKALIDKALLFSELIPAIKLFCLKIFMNAVTRPVLPPLDASSPVVSSPYSE